MAVEIKVEGMGVMDVARAVFRARWCDEAGRPLLWSWKRGFLEWHGGSRWRGLTEGEMVLELWRVLETVGCVMDTKTGEMLEYFNPDRKKVRDVLEALRSLTQAPTGRMPMWRGAETVERGMLETWVAFEDVIVEVGETAKRYRETGKYEWVTRPNTPDFVTEVSIRCRWNPEAVCERFEKFEGEWSGGDETKVEVSNRYYGYLVMGTRKYNRFLVQYGKVRSGKGTKVNLLKRMVGGWPAFAGTLAEDMAGEFGLEGLAGAHIVVVDEVGELAGAVGRRLGSLVKSAVGQTTMQVNAKGVSMIQEVLRCGLILVGNDPVVLPNGQRGVTSKMLPVKYGESFLGREDWELDERLWEEREGVARKWVEAAVRLEAEVRSDRKFVVGSEGTELREMFEGAANVWDKFLGTYFVEDPKWAVPYGMVRELARMWQMENRLWFLNKQGRRVGDRLVVQECLERSSWGVKPGKRHGGKNVVIGLRPKPGVEMVTGEDEEAVP